MFAILRQMNVMKMLTNASIHASKYRGTSKLNSSDLTLFHLAPPQSPLNRSETVHALTNYGYFFNTLSSYILNLTKYLPKTLPPKTSVRTSFIQKVYESSKNLSVDTAHRGESAKFLWGSQQLFP